MDKKTKPRRNSEKRREKSRDAARQRRNQETHIFTELADTLPLAKGKTRQLDKASIMRLTLCLMKQHEIRLSVKDTRQTVFDQTESFNANNNGSHVNSITDDDQSDADANSNTQSFSPKNNTRTAEDNNQPTITGNHSPSRECSSLDEAVVAQLYAKALDGFVIILSRDGEIVDVSEHVGKYLGIQQIDLLGQNIYEYIHPCDHEQLRSELGPSRAHRTAGVDTLPSPRQVFSLRVKSTLTAKGRNINLKSASYKVIKFSGQLLCPTGDINFFQSSSATSPASSSSSTSSSTACLPYSSSSPLDKASLQKKLAKHVAASTDADNDSDGEDGDDDDDDDVVVIEKKEFKSEANDDDEYSRQEIKTEKQIGEEGGDSRGGRGSCDQGPLHPGHHPNKHSPPQHCLQSEHLHHTSSSLHQQSSSLATSPITIKEETENGSFTCEAQVVGNSLSRLLKLPLHQHPPTDDDDDDDDSNKMADHVDDKGGETGSHQKGEGHHHVGRFRDNLKQKQDNDDEAKSGDSSDATADQEHKDSKCDDTAKMLSPCATPANRSRHVSGNSSDSSSAETGNARTGTAYFVAFGEPIPHPSNIEIPLGSQTFLSQHSMDMRFTIWDEKIKELVGYSSEDIIGHSIYEYYHGLDAETVGQAFKELMTKGQITTGQYRFLAKQGGHVWLTTQATVIYDNRTQKPLYVVCVHSVLSEIENQHEILSMVQQPLSSQSQPQTPSAKQSFHPQIEDLVHTNNSNTKHTNDHSVTSSSSSSSSTSTSATRKISMDRTQSYSLLVAPKVATSEAESQLLVKCKKENVVNLSSGGHLLGNNNNDDTKRSKDGRPLLTYKISKFTPPLSSTSSSLSSHKFVLSKLGDLVSQREAGPKSCDSRFYSQKDRHSIGPGFGGNKEEGEQQGEQRSLKKFKRKATNNEEERVNHNNNNMESNEYRSEKPLVKEENSIVDVVSCKDGAMSEDYKEEDSSKLKWRKRHPGSVVVNAFDTGIGAKMDVDEDDCFIDDSEVKETGETEMDLNQRMAKGNDVVMTEVIMANDFDTGTNYTTIEVSENGGRRVPVKMVDGRVEDKEMDFRKKKNEDEDNTIEMKMDDRDNRFDIGIRDYRNEANGNYEEDSEMAILEISASKQKAESNRQRKMKKKMKDDLNDNDPTRMSPPLPAISKKKKRTTTKTIEFMKEMKIASQESSVFSPHSLGYSLASPDFTAAPPALICDDDGNVCDAVVVASTEESQHRSPQSSGIASSDNRGLDNLGQTCQPWQSHQNHSSSHSPGPLLNTEKIFAPRTKDMDENLYINKNSTNIATIPTSFLSEANNKNNNSNNTTSSHDPAVTGSNGNAGSSTTGVTNMLIDDLVSPTTTLLLDEQGDSSSTTDCMNAFDDLTFRAPSAGDVCIDLSVPSSFETAFKVPTLDADDAYMNEVSMTEICDNKPRCLPVPDLSPQLQDFSIEEPEYDILQATLSSPNEGSLLLSPDIGDMLYSKDILSLANKTEASLDKGLMQTPPFHNSPSLQKSPSPVMLVNNSCNRNNSPGLSLSPNPESNFNIFASNKGPVITSMQQAPIPSNPNPNGHLQGGGERFLSKVVFNRSSPEPSLQQQVQPRTMKSNMNYPNPTQKAEELQQMFALNKEGSITEHPIASNLSPPPNPKLPPEKLQKYLFAFERSPGISMSEKEISQLLVTASPQGLIPIPNPDTGPNQTLMHIGKELPIQSVATKLKGPTPGKVRRLESMIMPEDSQFQGREGGGGSGDGGGSGTVQQGFQWNTAQARQLISEYGSGNNNKDSVLRNLLVSGEDRNNGYFVNQHMGSPYLMTQTPPESLPKLDNSFIPAFTGRRQTTQNPISVNTAITAAAANPIGNQHNDGNNNGSSMSTNSVKPTTNQPEEQNWAWWWALKTTVTSPTLTSPSSVITTSSCNSSQNIRVSNSMNGTTTNITSPLVLGSPNPPYDKRALFGEDLVGVGQLDQRELNAATRVSNPVKSTIIPTVRKGCLLPNSLQSDSPNDIQALYGERLPQAKGNPTFDVSHSVENPIRVTGTIANNAATSSSSNSSSSSSTRRMSSFLFDDCRALFGVDHLPGGQNDQALSNTMTKGSHSAEDTIMTGLSNAKSSSSSYDIRTLFGVDLIPAGQLNRVSNSREGTPPSSTTTTTTTTNTTTTPNDSSEEDNVWQLVARRTFSINSSATNSPRDAETDDHFEYNDDDDHLLVSNGDKLSLLRNGSNSMATESLSEAEQSPLDMTGIQNKNNNRNSGIQAPNTLNNSMKYNRVQIPKHQNLMRPYTFTTDLAAASKWLPRLTQTDCEVNAPVWSGDRLLNGTELLRALDMENIF
ncbi:uncharacterized protein LOC106870896 [Octopus bimaculoides]|uniref:Uncharacterized protein n=1 Tax=Octopus bimaculoides TaxID=37653 RepID=A0A0L8HG05_OCTBM|nr:uncharacterized protein LOC106870896 [Octopus bimaculoides]|eukprot:XP_014772617.1 PREDICTED: uncharacterized protein LOC106870896 [Octopus bimaculoides]